MEKKQTLLEAVTKDTKEISISRTDSRSLLQIGTEQIEVSDYQIKSSARSMECITPLRSIKLFIRDMVIPPF